MIVDTSALIAILVDEPERPAFLDALSAADAAQLSVASYSECAAVIDGRRDPRLGRKLDDLLTACDITLAEVTLEQGRVARAAYRDFGKGSGHRARLNFGDCFAYALARVTGEPLLFKGDDFGHTDLRSALG